MKSLAFLVLVAALMVVAVAVGSSLVSARSITEFEIIKASKFEADNKIQQNVAASFAPIPPVAPGNISAIFMCKNDTCDDSSCIGAQLVQNQCSFVDVADSWIIYSCLNNGTQVQLDIFPGKFEQHLCSKKNPFHLTLHFDTNKCVLPNQKGGYTVYRCGPPA